MNKSTLGIVCILVAVTMLLTAPVVVPLQEVTAAAGSPGKPGTPGEPGIPCPVGGGGPAGCPTPHICAMFPDTLGCKGNIPSTPSTPSTPSHPINGPP